MAHEARVADAQRLRAVRPTLRYAAPVIFLLPATILILLFFLLPVITTLGLSMTDISTLTFRQPKWVGLENYRDLFGDPFIGKIMATPCATWCSPCCSTWGRGCCWRCSVPASLRGSATRCARYGCCRASCRQSCTSSSGRG